MMETRKHDEDEFFLDSELHAFVDGKLPPDRVAIVEARLSGDRELAQAIESWTQARTLIRAAASAADKAPPDMRTELLARELTARVRKARLRGVLAGQGLRQVAASVAIFAAGWMGNSVFVQHGWPTNSTHEARFLQTVALDAEQLLELSPPSSSRVVQAMQDLSASIGGSVDFPSLDAFGLTLARATVTEGPQGPTVRLFYDTASGKRISVVMMRHPDGEPEYPYQVRSIDGKPAAYLTRGGIDYAILGEEDPVALATLAQALR
jgi:anti-sigma factor RsiW